MTRSQRRRLKRTGRLTLKLAAVVADPAGNRRTVARRVTLRRSAAARARGTAAH